MNRLQQRLAHIERAIRPEGRMCVIIDDGSEDIEARIARCRAETGLSDRDLVVIIKRFFERAPGEAPGPPWTMRPALASAQPQSRQRAPMARRKDLPMFSRIRVIPRRRTPAEPSESKCRQPRFARNRDPLWRPSQHKCPL
jgi:hypothetical protein